MRVWVLRVLSALGPGSPRESRVTIAEVEQGDIWHGAWEPGGSRQVGGDGRDALPGQKYRELRVEEGRMDAGGSQDIAHDSVAPWGPAVATPVLYGADTAVFC